jgi:hypothetical protein
MSNWVWLSRVTLLGVVGTAALATIFLSIQGSLLGTRNLTNTRDSNRFQAAAITAEEVQALNIPLNSASSPVPSPGMSQPEPLAANTPNSSEVSPTPAGNAPQKSPEKKEESGSQSQADSKSQEKKNASNSTSKESAAKGKANQSASRSPQSKSKGKPVAPVRLARPFSLQQTLALYSPIFATPTSIGMVAIGVAEGNYRLVVKDGTLFVQQTASYFGHTDPGNLSWGERVTNFGPCSDQGRSRGNIALAEQICLDRAKGQLPTHLVDLNAAGIDPNLDLEAVLNAADLYNQASPIHSRYFPKALAIARNGGLTGIEALAWARTASFYLNANDELDLQNGANQASGLLGICIREQSARTEWQCVHRDQMRRVKAITSVLDKYRQLAQGSVKK